MIALRDRFKTAVDVMRGKALGPNLDPSFFWSQGALAAPGILGQVQARPGQYHVWVHNACQAIIQPFTQIPTALYSEKKPEDLIFEHPVLRLMSAPNPYMMGTNFFEAILWNLLLNTVKTPGGQAFIVGNVPTNFRKGEVPQELWVFSDNTMSPTLDENGVLSGWELNIGNSHTAVRYSTDQVIRIRLFNPYDLTKGLSPLSAALIEVIQDAKAKEYNHRFLDNHAALGGMISMNGTPPGKAEFDQLKTQFQQMYSGFQNAGKTMFMPWALKYEQFARTHLDFEFMQQLGWNRDTILSAYRVNKWSVGLSEDLNFATAKEAKRQLFENVIIPYSNTVMQALNETWIRYVDKRDLRIQHDFSTVQALKEDRGQKLKDADIMIGHGVPPADAYEFVELGYDASQHEWLSEDRSLTGQMATSLEAPKQEEEEEEPKALPKEEKRLLITPRVVITKDERDNLSKFYVEKLFTPGEKDLMRATVAFFNSQRNAVLDQIDDYKGDPKKLKVKDLLLDIKKENESLMGQFAPHMIRQVKRTISQVRNEVKALSLDSTEKEIQAFLKARLLALSQINQTTFAGMEEKLSEAITDGLAEQMTMPELSKALKEGVRDVYKVRLSTAPTIARTETAVVTSEVRFDLFESSGIEKHEWLTAKDSKVRESHVSEDGHIVVIGKRFPSTRLLHPSDPGGAAAETINCRCVALPVEEE